MNQTYILNYIKKTKCIAKAEQQIRTLLGKNKQDNQIPPIKINYL